MKLILDFDDVLFDVTSLKKDVFSKLAVHGVQDGALVYEEERKLGVPFSLKRFLYRVLGQKIETKQQIDAIYEEIMNCCENYKNQNLLELVKNFGKDNCYIVTNGDQEFQADKITRTKLQEFFKQIIIVPGSKKEAVEAICRAFPEEQIIFADDKQKFFEDLDLQTFSNLTTVIYDGQGLDVLQKKIVNLTESEPKQPRTPAIENPEQMTPKMK